MGRLLRVGFGLFGAGLCLGMSFAQEPIRVAPALTMHFVHGRWWDGNAFRERDLYSAKGVLTATAPTHVDVTVDLGERYVVPPFGDAHEHNFSSVVNTPKDVAMYLRDGIFYAQGVTEPWRASAKVAGLVNRPDSVDVTYAHGGLTGAQGHPKGVYEALARGTYGKPGDHTAELRASSLEEGDAYWVIDTPEDLERKWPKILKTHPDLIKVYLTHSEQDAENRARTDKIDIVGLHPGMVEPIVERAHAAGLRVAAHVDTEADFRVALTAGVDEMAHLPGYCLAAQDSVKVYRLTDEDVRETAKRKVKVVVTGSVCEGSWRKTEDSAAKRALQVDDLRRLKAAGVPLLVGSDSYGSDSVKEALYLEGLGVWSRAEMLRMWSEETPRAIFPGRRLGRLEPGYEASFLVLRNDPLERWEATGEIAERWKQGRQLADTPAAK